MRRSRRLSDASASAAPQAWRYCGRRARLLHRAWRGWCCALRCRCGAARAAPLAGDEPAPLVPVAAVAVAAAHVAAWPVELAAVLVDGQALADEGLAHGVFLAFTISGAGVSYLRVRVACQAAFTEGPSGQGPGWPDGNRESRSLECELRAQVATPTKRRQ